MLIVADVRYFEKELIQSSVCKFEYQINIIKWFHPRQMFRYAVSLKVIDFGVMLTLGQALYLMFMCHALSIMLYVSCFMCQALCVILYMSGFMCNALCVMLYVSYFMCHALCFMLYFYALCVILCVMLYVSCFMCYALCIMLYVTCFMCHALCVMLCDMLYVFC